jgi:hypothetical protein
MMSAVVGPARERNRNDVDVAFLLRGLDERGHAAAGLRRRLLRPIHLLGGRVRSASDRERREDCPYQTGREGDPKFV